jgi:hypothetical protein
MNIIKGETASRDPTHKARQCEVGGLALYSRDHLSKRNIFQIFKLILFSDTRVSRQNILFARDIWIHINHVMRFILRPYYLFKIPAQRLPIPHQTVLPHNNIMLWIDEIFLSIH